MGELKLLFIHGAGGTKSKWRNVEPFFSKYSYQTIDLPGHGQNNTDLARSVEENASLINEYIDADTIIVGHSMGGLIGLELAATNNKVKGLVLASSFYEMPVHPKILTSLEDGIFPDSLFFASYSKDVNEDLIAHEKKEKESMPIETALKDFNACNNYKLGKNTLTKLKIPILSIYGSADRLLPNGVGEKLQVVNKDVRVNEKEDAGHYMILEEAELFSNELQSFYKEVEEQLL